MHERNTEINFFISAVDNGGVHQLDELLRCGEMSLFFCVSTGTRAGAAACEDGATCRGKAARAPAGFEHWATANKSVAAKWTEVSRFSIGTLQWRILRTHAERVVESGVTPEASVVTRGGGSDHDEVGAAC